MGSGLPSARAWNGRFCGKVLWGAVFPPPGHGTGVFTEKSYGQRFALRLSMKTAHQGACIFAENVSRVGAAGLAPPFCGSRRKRDGRQAKKVRDRRRFGYDKNENN